MAVEKKYLSQYIQIEDSWNEAFFEKFCHFKNYIYQSWEQINHSQHLEVSSQEWSHVKSYWMPEFIEDYRKLLSPDSLHLKDFKWRGYLCEHSRWMFFFDLKTQEIFFGRFEANVEAMNSDQFKVFLNELNQVWQHLIYEFCRDLGMEVPQKISGPSFGHFFIEYRWTKWRNEGPFYGEPVHHPVYISIFESLGFTIQKEWFSYKVDIEKTANNFTQIYQKKVSKKNYTIKLSVHFVKIWSWRKQLEKIYHLFYRLYSRMPYYRKISFEEFFDLYQDLVFLINPFFSYLVYANKNLIGFCINIFDHHQIIRKLKMDILLNKKSSRKCFFTKIFIFIKLFFNSRKLLISYVGREDFLDLNDKIKQVPIKGFQSLISRYLYVALKIFRVKEVYVCFVASDSPAIKSFNQENQLLVSQYITYEKLINLSSEKGRVSSS